MQAAARAIIQRMPNMRFLLASLILFAPLSAWAQGSGDHEHGDLDERLSKIEAILFPPDPPPTATTVSFNCDEGQACQGDIGPVDDVGPVTVLWAASPLTGFTGFSDGTWQAAPVDGDDGVYDIVATLNDQVQTVDVTITIIVADTIQPPPPPPPPGDWVAAVQSYIDANCDFATEHWCKLNTVNLLADMAPASFPNGEDYGACGPRCTFDDFSNWVVDLQAGKIYGVGGGHGNDGDGSIYGFDLKTRTWFRETPVPPLVIPTGQLDTDGDGVFDNCPVPEDAPAAFHTYGGKVLHGGWMYVFGMSQFCPTDGVGYQNSLRFGDPARQAEYEAQGWNYDPNTQIVTDQNGYPIHNLDYVHEVAWRYHFETKTWEHFPAPNSTQGAAAYIGNGQIVHLPFEGSAGYTVDTSLLPATPSGMPNPDPTTLTGGGGGTGYGTIRHVADPNTPAGAGTIYNIQSGGSFGQIIVRQHSGGASPIWDNIPGYGLGGWGNDFPWSRVSAMDLDTARDEMVIWNGTREIYAIPRLAIHLTTPLTSVAKANGLQRYPNAGGEAPGEATGEFPITTFPVGKLKYVPALDIFLGMKGGADPWIWMYKRPDQPGPDPEWDAVQADGFTCTDTNNDHLCPRVEFSGEVQLDPGIYEQPAFIDTPTTITGPSILQRAAVGNKAHLLVREGGSLTLDSIIGRDVCPNLQAAAFLWLNKGSGPVEIRNSTLSGHCNAILGQVDTSLLIEGSLLENNGGYANEGKSGRAHGGYWWGPGTATIRNSTIRCGQVEGHLIKSGLPHLAIFDSVLDERGDCLGSRVIDAFNGGVLELRRVEIYTHPSDGNPDVIGYDFESRSDGQWADNRIILDDVTVVCGGPKQSFIAGRNSLRDATIEGWDTVTMTGCAHGVLERAVGGDVDLTPAS